MPDAPSSVLHGVRVIVAGAGLAGLTAARTLSRQGADVRVVEARDRIGGRVWTFRAAPIEPFHAELGGEFIDRGHRAIRKLCKELDLPLVRVLERGFGTALEQSGRTRVFPSQAALWHALGDTLKPSVKAFSNDDKGWSGTASAAIARRSLRDALTAADAEPRLQAFATAMRGCFWRIQRTSPHSSPSNRFSPATRAPRSPSGSRAAPIGSQKRFRRTASSRSSSSTSSALSPRTEKGLL